ncbi:MAG: DUF3883 domain-containing protein [Candidatus Thorarchaeota archaeon]
MVSTRKFTIYLRNHWQSLLKKLLSEKELSFQDFFKFFAVSDVSKGDKNIYVRVMINRLLVKGIIKQNIGNGMYILSEEGLDRAVEEVNTGKFKTGIPYYAERELLSLRSLYEYLQRKKSFFNALSFLINEYWDMLTFWEDLKNEYGQIVYYVRAEFYYNKIIQSQLDINVNSRVLRKKNIINFRSYREIKKHFEKCIVIHCRKCGGNIINVFNHYIESVKYELREKEEYRKLIRDLKQLAYVKYEGINETSYKKYKTKIDSILNLKDDVISKENLILTYLDFELKMALIEVLSLNRAIIRESVKRKKADIMEFIDKIELYKKSFSQFINILTPSPLLDNINSRIIEKFNIDKKIFQRYNKVIKNLGREGEKRIYEGLKEDFSESIVIWNNKDGESGKPYDILLTMKNGEEKFIEVKTTHTDKLNFEMSETEIQFALDNSDRYKIYLIINFGKGLDTYIEEIENFKEIYHGKGTLQLISRKFKLI